jgi:D-glutamate N-acetyltransferase
MLDPNQQLAIYMEGCLGGRYGKMGHGVLRYSPNPVACVIDSRFDGKNVQDVISTPRSCPVVASVDEAADLGGEVLVLGLSPSGGRIPPEWRSDLDRAVERGMCLVNGLHDPLAPRYANLRSGQWVWDIRAEPQGIQIAAARARDLPNRRVLMVGTDMAVGKMTAGLEIHKEALRRGVRAEFLATGQIGITITGRGVPLDAIRLDYAAGAIEGLVMSAADSDLIILEGQGSLLHPGSSATLPLMRGLCPTHLIVCHRPGCDTLEMHPTVNLPPIKDFIRLYEDLAEACGAFARPKTVGVSLDTSRCDEPTARDFVQRMADESGLPTTDVVRYGCANLVDALLA